MTFYGKIINSQFVPDDPVAYQLGIQKREGKRTQIKIEAISTKRTLPQNALMWKIYEMAGDELGYTKEELHDTFKAMFTTDENGIVKGTHNMLTIEFIKFLDNVVRTLAEMGVVVPAELFN